MLPRRHCIIVLFLLALPAVVQGQFTFTTNNGSITITGYTGPGGVVAIPGTTNGYTVTGIGEGAFAFSTNLTSVVIPVNVTNIGVLAFAYCTNLMSAYFQSNAPPDAGNAFYGDPDAIVYYQPGTTDWGAIFGGAPTVEETTTSEFEYTMSDGSVTIERYNGPGGAVVIPGYINGYPVTSIGGLGPNGVFSPNVTSVIIPNTLTNIENSAFQNCGLISVNIPNGVISIGEDAFMDCRSLTNVIIANGVTTIGMYMFSECTSLISVTIPDSVSNIGQSAFQDCISLISVTIPSSVTSIGGFAFEDCTSLTSFVIPASVTSIGANTFLGCTSLTNISVDTANQSFTILNGILFDKAQDTIIEYLAGFMATNGTYTIPKSVTNIGDGAFQGCASLTSITIPSSVINIGTAAFYRCGLTSVTIPGSVTSIGPLAFAYCYSLTNVTIGNGITSIGQQVFYHCGITSITIPSSVTSIVDYAFEDCESLTSAYFPGNAPPDDGTVFNGDPATVYYLPGTIGWGATFGGAPTELWNPQATALTTVGGRFSFNITGPTNVTIVVEACTNLVNPVWLPVATNVLSGSGTSSFSDAQGTNYPNRYYRFSAP